MDDTLRPARMIRACQWFVEFDGLMTSFVNRCEREAEVWRQAEARSSKPLAIRFFRTADAVYVVDL